jgi:hypothetical protein
MAIRRTIQTATALVSATLTHTASLAQQVQVLSLTRNCTNVGHFATIPPRFGLPLDCPPFTFALDGPGFFPNNLLCSVGGTTLNPLPNSVAWASQVEHFSRVDNFEFPSSFFGVLTSMNQYAGGYADNISQYSGANSAFFDMTFRVQGGSISLNDIFQPSAVWATGSAIASFELSGPSGPIVAAYGTNPATPIFPPSAPGVSPVHLVPGVYSVKAIVSSAAAGSGPMFNNSSVRFHFAIGFDGGGQPCPSSIDVLNFNDPNVTSFAQQGRLMDGIVADGVSIVALRVPRLAGLGTMEWTLSTPEGLTGAAALGTFVSLNGTPLGVTTSTLPAPSAPGEYATVAYYRAPTDFVATPAHEGLGAQQPRQIVVSAKWHPTNQPECATISRIVDLHRPPVLLIHGLEDYPGSWQLGIQNDSRFVVRLVDWHTTHDQPVVKNREVIKPFVRSVLKELQAKGIAGTQVDVFAHSCGGLIARLYSMNDFVLEERRYTTDYLRADNFNKGDFHKLVAVCVPNFGSPIANAGVTLENQPTPQGLVAMCFSDGPNTPTIDGDGRCLLCGVVRDMRTDSPVLELINSRTVQIPVHAVLGVGGYDSSEPYENWPELKSYYWRTWKIARGCDPLKNIWQFFGEDQNDLVVNATSQRGGLSGTRTTSVTGPGAVHGYIIQQQFGNTAVNDAFIALLNATTTGSKFRNGFPTLSMPALEFEDCIPFNGPDSQVNILSPAPGTTVRPGQTLQVQYSLPAGTLRTIDAYFPTGQFVTVVSGVVGGSLDITVPNNYVGPIVLRVALQEPAPFLDRTCPAALTLNVEPSQPAQTITASPSAVMTLDRVRTHASISLSGQYADGMTADLSRAEAGTTYHTSDPTVVAVSPNGEVAARGIGSTIVTAAHLGLTSSVRVAVTSVKGDINGDGRVESVDAQAFAGYFTGATPAVTLVIARTALDTFDFDSDGDIDCDDWEAMTVAWTAANPPVGPSVCITCRADFNGVNGLTVQDLFDFLAGYFGGDARTDFNGSGSISVQDIFDFLAAFFTGCP